MVFIMTDVIGEIYGKPTAKLFVTCGLMSMVLFILYTYIVLLMPWGDRALWMRESYDKIFKLSARISIASVAAYAIAEYQDVFSFFLAKKFFGEKYFWLRSNISNVWSQFLDSAIFMFIAFLGVYPLKTILLIIIPWWIYKTLMGFAYTPLSYFGLYLLRKDYGSKACKNAGI
ncbi:MAG: queuosine precursor transporter [Elusimicrobia bacterium]|nr:queuosine precursor transporter [Elusimicrobiota bacterium]